MSVAWSVISFAMYISRVDRYVCCILVLDFDPVVLLSSSWLFLLFGKKVDLD